MSTPENPESGQLTRRQMRQNRTASTPVVGSDTALATEEPPAPKAPLPRPAEPVAVAPPPVPDAAVDLGVAPLTRRQARQQERIRTASVPVITPEIAAAYDASGVEPSTSEPEPEAVVWTPEVAEERESARAADAEAPAAHDESAPAVDEQDEVGKADPSTEQDDASTEQADAEGGAEADGGDTEAVVEADAEPGPLHVETVSDADSDPSAADAEAEADVNPAEVKSPAGAQGPAEAGTETDFTDAEAQPADVETGKDETGTDDAGAPEDSDGDENGRIEASDAASSEWLDPSDAGAGPENETPRVDARFGDNLLAVENPADVKDVSFDELLTRDSSGSGSVSTPHALILTHVPEASPLSAVTSTGEVIVTGIYNLPDGLGSQGHAHGAADGKEIDATLIDGELPASSSPTPIAASAAISTVRGAGEIIRPPAPEKSNRWVMGLMITAGALALALVGLLVYVVATGVFN